MSAPEYIVGAPWWMNESLDVVQRCFPAEVELLTECQYVRFMRELGAEVSKSLSFPSGILDVMDAVSKEIIVKECRLMACKAARGIFGRML